MESSRQSGFIKRTLAAAVADGSGNPPAFAFPAVHNLGTAARRRPRPDAEIADGEVSWPAPLAPKNYPNSYVQKRPRRPPQLAIEPVVAASSIHALIASILSHLDDADGSPLG